mgnify:FL=1|jgi:hypothetical protein
MKRTTLLLIIIILVSCSNKQEETKLKNRITELEMQLDECLNGAEKIHSKVKLAFQENNLTACKDYYFKMKKLHPNSELFNEVKKIYERIINEEKKKAEKERLLKEKQDREKKLLEKREKEKKLKALKKLRKKLDDVSGITWYKQPYFTHYTNRYLTSIYMGERNDSRWLRLQMSYAADDWIFFERAYLSYDGNTKEILFNKYDEKETDNDSGGISEWIDVTVTEDVKSFLEKFAKSKKAKMRFTGKYTKTRTLTYNERRGILDILNGYEILENMEK